MPAAQVARAWLQMVRSKAWMPPHSYSFIISSVKDAAPPKSRPVLAAGSSDCGSITEGQKDFT